MLLGRPEGGGSRDAVAPFDRHYRVHVREPGVPPGPAEREGRRPCLDAPVEVWLDDGGRDLLSPVEGAEVRAAVRSARHDPHPGDVVVPEHRGDHDARQSAGAELAAHGDAGEPSVAVVEGVDVGHEVVDEQRPRERVVQAPQQ